MGTRMTAQLMYKTQWASGQVCPTLLSPVSPNYNTGTEKPETSRSLSLLRTLWLASNVETLVCHAVNGPGCLCTLFLSFLYSVLNLVNSVRVNLLTWLHFPIVKQTERKWQTKLHRSIYSAEQAFFTADILTCLSAKKTQVPLITLMMALFYSGVPVSHDGVRACQHEQYPWPRLLCSVWPILTLLLDYSFMLVTQFHKKIKTDSF